MTREIKRLPVNDGHTPMKAPGSPSTAGYQPEKSKGVNPTTPQKTSMPPKKR
ncbi:hypothetical protein [Acinetobacter sp. 197]|uniref:hypothetical protein n=1 Tax=Acinetobacter sp. 197 TaxID=3114696 RepID=UPI003A84F40F